MNQQDILPTWQWAFSENGILTANWDFNFAYTGGNSLKVRGNLPANHPIDLMLYKTKLSNGTGAMNIEIQHKRIASPTDPKIKLLVVFADDMNQKYEFTITNVVLSQWMYGRISTPSVFSGREIAMLGFRFETPIDIPNYEINIGRISIQGLPLDTTDYKTENSFVTVSYPSSNSNAILFDINWPNSTQLKYTVTDLQGKIIAENNINLNNTTTYSFPTNGLSKGTYIVKFRDESNRSEVQKIIIK
jgi:hypothetical protein